METLNNRVSVAIPTYNSSQYIWKCIKPLLSSKFIDQIIISDDCSNDEEYLKLTNIINKIKKNTPMEIILTRNRSNLGAFRNKYKCIEMCRNELVYQLDSDNIPRNNIDSIIDEILSSGSKDHLFLPSKIYQFRNNHINAKYLSLFDKKYVVRFSKNGKLIDLLIEKDFYKKNTKYTLDKNLSWVLNIGNFFTYKSTFKKFTHKAFENLAMPLAMDAVAISYFYLSNQGKLNIVKNFYHFHRKREDSVSFTSGEKSDISLDFFKKQYLKD